MNRSAFTLRWSFSVVVAMSLTANLVMSGSAEDDVKDAERRKADVAAIEELEGSNDWPVPANSPS